MNIQIFGRSKCFETKKAERYFKERRVKYQYIDILRYGLSKGELTGAARAAGGLDALINELSPDYDGHYMNMLTESGKQQALLENSGLYKTPIVRNGKLATVGYKPDIWKDWD